MNLTKEQAKKILDLMNEMVDFRALVENCPDVFENVDCPTDCEGQKLRCDDCWKKALYDHTLK